MTIKVYYNKNLKMSEGKLAAKVGHVLFNLGMNEGLYGDSGFYSKYNPKDIIIIVLGLRRNKFKKMMDTKYPDYVQEDLGFTEAEEGTITAFGYIEE